jgi:hypothetical protein
MIDDTHLQATNPSQRRLCWHPSIKPITVEAPDPLLPEELHLEFIVGRWEMLHIS